MTKHGTVHKSDFQIKELKKIIHRIENKLEQIEKLQEEKKIKPKPKME